MSRPSSSPRPGLPSQGKLPSAPLTSKPKGTVPLKRPPEQSAAAPGRSQKGGTQLLGSLDMQNWDRDPADIYKLLTSKELLTDEHSGLVQSE